MSIAPVVVTFLDADSLAHPLNFDDLAQVDFRRWPTTSPQQVAERIADADVVIVNTCSFIDASKHEALEAIYEMSDGKATARKKGQKLIVAGCMSQRYQGALPVVEGAKEIGRAHV